MREWLIRPILALKDLLQMVQENGQSSGIAELSLFFLRVLFFLASSFLLVS